MDSYQWPDGFGLTEEIWDAIQDLGREEEIFSTSFVEENEELSKKIESLKKVQFCGKSDLQHPKNFIETFERVALENNLSSYDKHYYFKESLVGEAANCLQNCQMKTYEEIKNDFLNFYWCQSRQQSFLEDLEVGKYDKKCGLSVRDYFLRIYNWAQFLEPSAFIESNSLVQDIMLHFEDCELTEEEIAEIEKVMDDFKVTKASKNTILPKTPERPISDDTQDNQNKDAEKKIDARFDKSVIIFILGISLGFFFAIVLLYSLIFNSYDQPASNSNLQQLCPFEILKFSGKDLINPNHFIEKLEHVAAKNNSNSLKLDLFEKLKFSGTKDSINPKKFIENFEYLAAQEKLDARSKEHYFIKSLVDGAEKWIMTCGFGTYEEMKENFLEYYWGRGIQNEFLEFLQNGKYSKESGLSPKEYFFKNFNEAQFLNNAPREEEVISNLLNHFSFKYHILWWTVNTVKTVNEALDLLVPSNMAVHWYERYERYERYFVTFLDTFFYKFFLITMMCIIMYNTWRGRNTRG